MQDTALSATRTLGTGGIQAADLPDARDALQQRDRSADPPVSAMRARLVRTRVAKKVKMRASDSDAAILAAWQRCLMRADPKRHKDAASCAYVTGFLARLLAREPQAVALWEEYVRSKAAVKDAGGQAEHRPAGARSAFARVTPKDNPELSEAMRALA